MSYIRKVIRDEYGRRAFLSESRAFKAQKLAMTQYGICTGVIKLDNGRFVLLHDPLTEEN